MSRSYSVSERGASGKAQKAPPVAPSAFEELGLPSLVGVENSNLKSIFGKRFFDLKIEAMKKLDELHPKATPERQAAYERLNDWENAAEKYIRHLEKQEKSVAIKEKTLAKYNRVQDDKRVRAISETMIKSLRPQELAMADGYERSTLEKIESLRDELEKYDGLSEKMPYHLEKELAGSPYIKNEEISGQGSRPWYRDADGRDRVRMKFSIANGLSPAAVRRTAEWRAHDSILSFTDKLVRKTEELAGKGERLVGEPKVRKSSNNPWSNSIIEIRTNSRIIKWETNMIMNRSKYDRNFNQWPTRLISNEKITNNG